MRASYLTRFGSLSLICGILLVYSSAVFSQQTDKNKNNQEQSGTQTQTQSAQSESEMGMEGEFPALGVMVLPSPGQGVLVASALWGSPAQEVGIQSGDFIMSINQQAVSTPTELQTLVRQLPVDSPVQIEIWRNGQTINTTVELARQSDSRPDSHRTWIGVVFTPSNAQETQGVVVSHVFPNSPAEESGLQAGDIISKAGGKQVTGITSLLQCLEDHGPNTGCDLEVVRNRQTKEIQLKLGDLAEAPYEWTSVAFRTPYDLLNGDPAQDDLQGGGHLQSAVEQLQRDVNRLQTRLDALESRSDRASENRDRQQDRNDGSQGSSNSRTSGGGPSIANDSISFGSDTSQNPALAESSQFTVQERGRQGRNRDRDDDDWRRGNRNSWNWDRYPYRYNYGYYTPRYNYRTWYYPYQGNRWYYNDYNTSGFQYYGPRFGIRIGPFWGSYWY